MIEITQYLVGKVVSSDNSNTVAKRLLRSITAGIEQNLTWQLLFIGKENDISEPSVSLKYNFTAHNDFRLKSIIMKGFRKFPYRDNLAYTLDFTKTITNKNPQKNTRIPCSCFFIGSNGTGKTSIFSAIQDTCSDCFSAADSRGITKQSFMSHAGVEPSKVDVTVETVDCGVELQNPSSSSISLYRKFLRPFFCSEYDIRQMTESNDITNYIISQTGYNDIHKIIDSLENIYEERKNRLSELKEKEKNESLSKRNKIKDPEAKQKLLESVFSSISKYKLQEVKVDDIEKLRRLIGMLKHELKISSKKLDRISKKLSAILVSLDTEKNLLYSCNIKVDYITKSYSSVISQIQMLIEEIGSEDDINKSEVIAGINIPRMKAAQLNIAKRISLLNLEELNGKRKNLAEILSILTYSIKDNEKYISFIKGYLSYIDNLKSTENTDTEETSMSETDELRTIEVNIESLRQCIDELKKHYNAFLRSATSTTKSICEQILKDFDMEGEKLEISIDKDDNSLRIEYNVNKIPLNPLLLLNSFRFKLYTLCVKISMAFSVMKYMKLSFPLVFDDVFYSSDFVNREKVRDFIEKIYNLYNEIINDESHPLQIIFFTHDEVVLEAAVKGIISSKINVMYKYGRIFNYQEMEQEDTTNGHCELSVIYG